MTGIASSSGLTTVRTVGGLIPADLLARILAGEDLEGLTGDDFHLELGLSPKEAANRAWSVLTGAWAGYRDALASRPPDDRATALTREKWLLVLMRELGFGRVPTTPAGGLHADGRSIPVSHLSGAVPIHLLGRGVGLDHKSPGVAGAADRAPHAMVQELLNRSDDHLWAILANSTTLRLLRDSSNLVGQAYVEFDLAAMFDNEVFSDFVALYLLAHQTRFEPVDPDAGPEDCWLERWRASAVETGARALGQLRDGVKLAIEALGTGFLRHPDNAALRERLEPGGDLDLADYHRALLRLVYRLLFCFVAEDRGLLLDPDAPDAARRRYDEWFSTARLRRIATRRRGTRHDDLWLALSLVLDGLGRDEGRPELGLPGLGGLFVNGPLDVVAGQSIGNDALLAAIRHLCVIQPKEGGPRRTIDYQHLGAEELGSIYESLLELVPRYDGATRTFTLELLAGNERKTSGAYYTPSSLIECLLESALDPLLDEAEAAADPEAALLELTVCDPACGSGHFLVAAAKRIAHRLARARAEDAEPTVLDAQEAMRDVVASCIYGVDLNPMAAELAKVSLWLESVTAGRPLGFLDHHVKVGNALLGTTPALLAAGVPDDAFAVLEGDDRSVVTALKKRNRTERAGQEDLFSAAGITVDTSGLADAAREIDALGGLDLASIHLAEQRQRALEHSPELAHARFLADAWCAAFVVPKNDPALGITDGTLRRWSAGSLSPDDDPRRRAVETAATQYRFFHWHLEYPQIFTLDAGADGPGWAGGFHCVVGNPPWERVKLQEQEYFAARSTDIAAAPNAAARKRLIAALNESDPGLHRSFAASKRRAEGESHLLRGSGRYPLCGRGDINTYAVFAEHDCAILSPSGRCGVILPTGIATDATTQHFFKNLVTTESLASLYDFENSAPQFEGVHRSFKFCLLTLSGREAPVEVADFAFFVRHTSDLARPGVRFALASDEINLLNPNSGTCPVFRSRRDAALTLSISRGTPVLRRDNDPNGGPWELSLWTMFHMTNDSALLRQMADDHDSRWLPVYEGKMVTAFDHRSADIVLNADNATRQQQSAVLPPQAKLDPSRAPHAVFEAPVSEVAGRGGGGDWVPVLKRVSAVTNSRTAVACMLPRVAVSYTLYCVRQTNRNCVRATQLLAVLNSFPFDFLLRSKTTQPSLPMGVIYETAVVTPLRFDELNLLTHGVTPAVLELTYTSWDMRPFAKDLGDNGPPFRWDEERRAVLRAELDAACFHLYDITDREDVDHILGTFPIVNRKDRDRFGEERTRRLVLENYDRMSEAARTGVPFESSLDPAPGLGPRHPERAGK